MNTPQTIPAYHYAGQRAIACLVLGAVSCLIPVVLSFSSAIFFLIGFAPVLVWHVLQVIAAVLGVVVGLVSLRAIRLNSMPGRGLVVTGIVLCFLSTLVIMPLVVFGKVLPTVGETRHQIQSMQNLQVIVKAMHKYHDQYGRFPPACVFNKEGQPLLSWRVMLLPFLGHTQLYQQFKLDEAWDSPSNKRLLPFIPEVLALPRQSGTQEFSTNYLVCDGPGAVYQTMERPKWFDDELNRARTPSFQVFPQRIGEQPIYDFGKRASIMSITDGPANTILIVQADESVPWSKPQDLPYAADRSLPKLGGHYSNGDFVAALADGSVRVISKRVSEQSIRDAITASGNEVPKPDWIEH